jgi:hypothetical protein
LEGLQGLLEGLQGLWGVIQTNGLADDLHLLLQEYN